MEESITAKPPIMHATAPTVWNYVAPNVTSTKVGIYALKITWFIILISHVNKRGLTEI